VKFLKVNQVRKCVHDHTARGKRKQVSREFLAALDRLIASEIECAVRNSNGMTRIRACDLGRRVML